MIIKNILFLFIQKCSYGLGVRTSTLILHNNKSLFQKINYNFLFHFVCDEGNIDYHQWVDGCLI